MTMTSYPSREGGAFNVRRGVRPQREGKEVTSPSPGKRREKRRTRLLPACSERKARNLHFPRKKRSLRKKRREKLHNGGLLKSLSISRGKKGEGGGHREQGEALEQREKEKDRAVRRTNISFYSRGKKILRPNARGTRKEKGKKERRRFPTPSLS